MTKNFLSSSRQVYDAGMRELGGEAEVSHGAIVEEGSEEGAEGEPAEEGIVGPRSGPTIFGPPTNFEYKRMMPLPRFCELLGQNRRPWLRIYEEEAEKERLEAIQAARNKKLTAA